ncbi:twin-arginine translocase subunit TatB [Pseudohalioglobus sediminis]|uniref:Sec-independent protein translocase protein TatB n=1 Tax=Pseudohalioglobus sediminis TaxID=2606449 RepID=A0A5B0WTE1_9GAMM|nr:Sec-independent protein translocase protein TatB [Pseudohalioglobus sediminis]KAA1189757.1 twin-arginine translocase subunit TatB [Pseudohalioglobus sediminis]
MFDIGFTELVIVAIVGLLVIGPERLPGAIRTASAWLGRIKRGFNDIKREVEQELHNDAVMQELKQTGQQLREESSQLSDDVRKAAADINPLDERPGSDAGNKPE